MWKLLDARRAEYPAEHNVGHLYIAKPALANFIKNSTQPIALMWVWPYLKTEILG